MAVLFDQARRYRTRLPAHAVGTLPDPLVAGPEVGIATRVDIDRAIAELPRRQRQVVTLFYLADLPVREVSAVLGIGEGSVKAYLSDARSELRAALEEK